VTPDDIRAVAVPVLRHRVQLNFNAQADGVGADRIVADLVAAVPVEDVTSPGARELERLVKP
jgi:MoxR-like ATPase